MEKYRTVNLGGKFPPAHTLKFLEALIPGSLDSPIALVMYALNNEVQKLGIRLDLNKQSFIDHPFEPGSSLDKIANEKAPDIALFVKKKFWDLRIQSHEDDNGNFKASALCTQ